MERLNWTMEVLHRQIHNHKTKEKTKLYHSIYWTWISHILSTDNSLEDNIFLIFAFKYIPWMWRLRGQSHTCKLNHIKWSSQKKNTEHKYINIQWIWRLSGWDVICTAARRLGSLGAVCAVSPLSPSPREGFSSFDLLGSGPGCTFRLFFYVLSTCSASIVNPGVRMSCLEHRNINDIIVTLNINIWHSPIKNIHESHSQNMHFLWMAPHMKQTCTSSELTLRLMLTDWCRHSLWADTKTIANRHYLWADT